MFNFEEFWAAGYVDHDGYHGSKGFCLNHLIMGGKYEMSGIFVTYTSSQKCSCVKFEIKDRRASKKCANPRPSILPLD